MAVLEERRRHDNSVYALLDAAPTTLLVVTSDGTIDYCNAAAHECFGYPAGELVGRAVGDLLPSDQAEGDVDLRSGLDADPSGRTTGAGQDLIVKRKDGSLFPAEVSLIPVETGQGTWVLVSVLDITERLAYQKRLRDLNDAYLTLARMNQAIVRAPDELTLFTETCRIAVEQGGYLGAWVGRRGEGSGVECVASAGAVDDFLAQLSASTDPTQAHGQGPTGRVLRDGVSRYVQHYATDDMTAPWHELAAGFGIEATATLPLRCDHRTVATLSLYSATPQAFDDEVRSLLEGMADNISFALNGFDAVAQLQELARQRRDLSRRLVAAQEAERARIAADVHDDSVQALAALGLRLGLLKREVAKSAPHVVESVEQLLSTVGTVSAGLRDLLFELEPAGADVPLPEMLEEAVAHVFEDEEVRCSVVVNTALWNGQSSLSRTERGQALRIVKEALFNARKHAHASEVTVLVAPGPDGVWVTITDNGVGFEVAEMASAPGHRGLANMFDRAVVSGGTCGMESSENGTAVRFWMPYDEDAPPWVGRTRYSR